MAEYPVKSTSQGTYGRIEQRSEVKRETYKMCRAGGREDWSWKPLAYDIAGDYFQALRHITAPAAPRVRQQLSLIITLKIATFHFPSVLVHDVTTEESSYK